MLQTRLVKPTTIVIHHSATRDNDTISWGAIERFHKDTNKWSDIGYHAGVELVGGRPYALIGRPEWAHAAAVKEKNMNQLGLHVCVVGDYDKMVPSDELLRVLADRIIKPWMVRYNIPVNNITTHHSYASYKSCPGTLFPMDKLKGLCT